MIDFETLSMDHLLDLIEDYGLQDRAKEELARRAKAALEILESLAAHEWEERTTAAIDVLRGR